MSKKPQTGKRLDAGGILPVVRSPLSFLTLAAIICDGVFAIVGVAKGKDQLIVFAMHMFLAIIATVVLLALWSPASLYHPDDFKGVDRERLIDPVGRWVVTGVLLAALVFYTVVVVKVMNPSVSASTGTATQPAAERTSRPAL